MPATTRVSDLARELGMEPRAFLALLRSDFGLRVRTVSSSIPNSDARKVRNRLRLQARRAQRTDPKAKAEERIRRAAEQKRLREAAEARARAAAAVKVREAAEKKAREEAERRAREAAELAERKAREQAARAAREQAAREAREQAAREAAERAKARAAAEQAARAAAAKRAAERPAAKPAAVEPERSRRVDPEPGLPREPRAKPRTEPRPKPRPEPRTKPRTEPRAKPRTEPRAKPRTEPRAKPRPEPRTEPRAEPRTPAPPAAPGIAARPAPPAPGPAAPPGPRRVETPSITSPARGNEFRPGATDRKIVPTVVRPVRRATPPRIRATPPPLRRTPPFAQKPRRPGPGRRARGRNRQAPAETPEVIEGFDSQLPPGLRQAVTREFRTSARVELGEAIPVKELAEAMSIPTVEVIKALLVHHGVAASINHSLDSGTAALLVRRFGGSVVEAGESPEPKTDEPLELETDEGLVERAPVVTVMGHVDHGKTSLLDAIRESRVAEGEAGGITQHMSAYAVDTNGHRIVFLDTPGHEAFTKMRARGAGVTDVVILVVAADDGVKEQTIEALNHARSAEVPIVVAVNKMDRPGADPDQVMRQLAERGLTPEEWGGDTILCRVSAKTREGLPDLLQSVLDVAELEEPMANPAGPARGVVLEARKDKGRGLVAQFLVQTGTLAVGDTVSAGPAWGKVRALLGESGQRMKTAPPSTPVEVLGLAELPVVGDRFAASESPAEARRTAEARQEEERLQVLEGRQRLNLQNLHAQMSGGLKEISIVLKADVGGTVEAVRDALARLSRDEVKVRVIHAAAGAVSESDVSLAAATDAIIVAFGVRPDPSAERLAEREGVDIRAHTVIYHLTEEIEKALTGLLEPETEIVELGRIEVRQTFQVPRVGVVAGSHVLSGRIPRSARVRLVRDGRLVHEGRIGSLRRFKDDVSEVREGFECGLGIAGYNDVKVGDIIEAYREEQVRPEAG